MALALGIDIGTTAVKCALVDTATRAPIASAYVQSSAYVDCGEGRAEQSVETILQAVVAAINKLPSSALGRTETLGICGQMHGIVWWRAAEAAQAARRIMKDEALLESPPWSRLITWEDQRCSPAFIQSCEERIAVSAERDTTRHCSRLSTGYGLATYAHVLAHDATSLAGYDACGTIHDLLAFILSGHTASTAASIDTTDACSWGCYDIQAKQWNWRSIDALGIPRGMLPAVKSPGTVVGHATSIASVGLPAGAAVLVPMGDHPCSVVASVAHCAQDPAAQALSLVNIGTSAQLAMILPLNSTTITPSTTNRSFELRPFLTDDSVLGVAAALSGGNMFAWLMQRCRQWMEELGCEDSRLDDAAVYDRLIALGMKRLDTTLQFSPTLNGERGAPDATGAISSLQLHNASIGDLSAALCRGLVENLVQMVPSELQYALRSSRMIATGSALVRNPILRHFLAKALDNPSLLEIHGDVDAAVGAALRGSLTTTSSDGASTTT